MVFRSLHFLHYTFSETTRDLWQKMRDGKLLFVQIAVIWVLPSLIWIPAWLEEVEFKTGNGTEDGHICYAMQNGTKVHVTKTQLPILFFTDIMVLLTLIVSCGILMWSFRKEVAETMEYHKNDKEYIKQYRETTLKIIKKLKWSTVLLCIVYFILRVPWLIFAGHDAESFAYGFHICSILYIMKYSIMVIFFGLAHQNFRKAYLDILKLSFPCCFKP